MEEPIRQRERDRAGVVAAGYLRLYPEEVPNPNDFFSLVWAPADFLDSYIL